MFTGIVEELGIIRKISRRESLSILEIEARQTIEGTKIGDSIAVNGVCLTVISISEASFGFEVMDVTLKNTNLGLLKKGEKVNLERSLKFSDRVSGHFVSGHIDSMAIIRKRRLYNKTAEFQVVVKPEFAHFCINKGSIALDGISLTLARVSGNMLTVGIIPHTLENTTLGFKRPADRLNVEFDMLAKTISRQKSSH